MFAPSFFAPTFFTPIFWPPSSGLVITPEENFGGNQFLVFKPLLDSIKGKIPINEESLASNEKIVAYFQSSANEIEIDGKAYGIVRNQTPEQIISGIKDVGKIIEAAAAETGISYDEAEKALYDQVVSAMAEVEEIKASIFNDDGEIIMILIALDEL